MKKKECIVCQKSLNEVPLTSFDFKEYKFWICPKHLPILIHSPQKLSEYLPGANEFEGAPH